jgi:hypothetical protein
LFPVLFTARVTSIEPYLIVLAKYRSVQERQQYLAEQARQGNRHSTLQFTAQDLLWIACKLSIYPDLRTVTMEQVRARADDWKKREPSAQQSVHAATIFASCRILAPIPRSSGRACTADTV